MQFDNYIIRLLQPEDLENYFNMVDKNRKRLEDFFTGTVSKTQTIDDTKQFVEDITNLAKEKKYLPYVIEDTTNKQLIGFMDLKNIDWSIPKSEIGGYIDEDYANKGIITQAFTIFCDHCFNDLGFNKLFFRTHKSNTPVHRIAERCGFEKEGIIRKDYKTTSGEVIDLVYYGKIK